MLFCKHESPASCSGLGFWLCLTEALLFTYFASPWPADRQGLFPRLENVGVFKNISVVPSQATCGLLTRSMLCDDSAAVDSNWLCTQRVCLQDCPVRPSPPTSAAPFCLGLGSCLSAREHDLPPSLRRRSTSFIFGNHKNCFSSPSPRLAASLALATWLKSEEGGVMCVTEQTVDEQTVFKLTVSEKETMFYYHTVDSLQPPIKVMTLGRILVKRWIRLFVQVHQTKISFFINELEDENTEFDTRALSGLLTHLASGPLQIGQSFYGLEQFVGRRQDFQLYQVALANREILEVFSGDLPRLYVQLHRHLRVFPQAQRLCIPSGAKDTTGSRGSRSNPESHPLSFVNDNDVGTSWISHVFTNMTQLNHRVTISVDLGSGQYQVLFIIIQLFSPQPTAMRIQRKKDMLDWEDWQYFARNCSAYEVKNNGDLENPEYVNCHQLSNVTPYSNGNITFSILTPGVIHHSKYSDFYNTLFLELCNEFLEATQIRLHFHGQYYTTNSLIGHQHRYYLVNEVIVTGRCQCHSHAEICDTTGQLYQCLCAEQTFSKALHCGCFSPLCQDKPFRLRDQVHTFSCKPCQCLGHARCCHDNISLNPVPVEHHRGDDRACEDGEHYMTGRNCEMCKDYFFQQVGTDPSAMDVCKSCDCDKVGARNNFFFDQVGDQCNCKRHVSGRHCNQCQNGFYNPQRLDPEGCKSCDCNTSEMVEGAITCHPNSGQCKCKVNVIGLKCNQCNFGFKFLRSFPDDGCEDCQCNLHGSVDKLCNALSGQCKCKKETRGLHYDTCREHLYGPDVARCKACDCDAAVSLPGSVCDARTGQGARHLNIGGRQCNEYLEGYFYLQQSKSVLCLPCNCAKAGTINDSACDTSTGLCPCKLRLTGPLCDQCESHRYNVIIGNFQGCRECACNSLGTYPRTICDPVSGQCPCLPNIQGRRCDHCQPGFYMSPGNATSFLPCSCHSTGAAHPVCCSLTSQCLCQDASVTGQSWDHCKDFYFGFGRCQSCNCHISGALNETSHSVAGQCFCERFVTGTKCDACVPSASHLDVSHLWGCSKTPSQQPPPRGQVQSSLAINLSWSPPDSPNVHWLTYSLFRDGFEMYTTENQYPYDTQHFSDTPLSPFPSSSDHIATISVPGLRGSTGASYRTVAGIPEGSLSLSSLVTVASAVVMHPCATPSNHRGPMEREVLSCAPAGGIHLFAPCEAHEALAIIWNLAPVTKHYSPMQSCTSGGCLQSSPLMVTTTQSPPQEPGAPEVSKSCPTELHVEWSPPREPNGVITRYEVYVKRLRANGRDTSAEPRVFQSSGWASPHPSAESATKKAGKTPLTSRTIADLAPYTQYQFGGLAGSVASARASERTGGSAPVFITPPSVSPFSPHSLNVYWEKPADNVTRGKVVGCGIHMPSEESPQQFSLVVSSQIPYQAKSHEWPYIGEELRPCKTFNFTVVLCISAGCATSSSGAGHALAAAPANLRPPLVGGINNTTIQNRWLAPQELHGPSPPYLLGRRETSLLASRATMMQQVHYIGKGYDDFPRTTHPIKAVSTGIKASSRAVVPEGVLAFLASPGPQEEYYALWLKNGRPCFLFAPQGSSVEVTTTNDDGQQCDDGKWHEIIASRHQAFGQITLDGQYTGSLLALNGSLVPGESSGVSEHQGYAVLRKEPEIPQKAFVGCLQDVSFVKNYNPTGVCEPLIWQNSEEQINVSNNWEGCPSSLHEGAQVLGTGLLELLPNLFHEGMNFEISFNFRTDRLNGWLLFVYNKDGPDVLAIEPKSGRLSFWLSTSLSFTRGAVWLGPCCCDGEWNTVIIQKGGSVMSAGMNNLMEGASQPQPQTQPLTMSFLVYLGGGPLLDACRLLSLEKGFSGCRKDVEFAQGAAVHLASVSSSAVRVNLDGCPSADSTVNCRGNDSILAYLGTEERACKSGLQHVTDHLLDRTVLCPALQFRTNKINFAAVAPVPARDRVGWVFARGARGVSTAGFSTCVLPLSLDVHFASLEAVLMGLTSQAKEVNADVRPPRVSLQPRGPGVWGTPQSVPTPSRVRSLNGYSMEVTWDEPAAVRGVAEEHVLAAYIQDHPCPLCVWAAASEFVYTSTHTGILTGWLPFRSSAITLTACTLAGCTERTQTLNISTPQEAPQELLPPVARSLPNLSLLTWNPPKKASSIISQYSLYMDGMLIYSDSGVNHPVTDLAVFPAHQFLVRVCTYVGSTDRSLDQLHPVQMPPENVDSPKLTVLDSTAFYIQWKQPRKVNGILEYCILHISNHTHGFTMWDVIHKNTELFEDRTLRYLSPGNKYLFTLGACTGGCTVNVASEAQPEERGPEGSPVPKAHSDSPHSNISWSEPEYPNGVITSYELYLHGLLVHNSSKLSWHASGFVPGSLHIFRVHLCMAKGYSLGPQVENCSLEAPPEGAVSVLPKTEGSQEAHMRWEAPPHPNEHVLCSIICTGILYAEQAYNNGTLLNGTQIIHSAEENNLCVSIHGLASFPDCTVQVEASDSSDSSTRGPPALAEHPGAPDGTLPPRLSSAAPARLQVVWSTPALNNAPGCPRNRFQMRTGHPSRGFLQLFSNPSATVSYEVREFQFYTECEFWLVASSGFSSASGPQVPFMTTEDRPVPIEPPTLLDTSSRLMLVTWQHPLQCNGVITYYTICQVGHLCLKISGNVTNCMVTQFRPHTTCEFQVEASTAKGCSLSAESQTNWTLPAAPEGIPAPELLPDSSISVILSWQSPTRPSSLAENFRMDRRVHGKEEMTVLATLPKSHPMRHIDKTDVHSLWTRYEFKVLLSPLRAGTDISAWAEVTTRPFRSAGIQALSVQVLGPEAAKVTWNPPLILDGNVLSYESCLPDPHVMITGVNATSSVFSHVIMHLKPFLNYSITIVSCSGRNRNLGKCTEHLPAHDSTQPTLSQDVRPLLMSLLSASCIGSSWQNPLMPKGTNLRKEYELLRCKIQQPLASNPPEDLNLWHNIYSGTRWFYEDKALSRFTTCEYKELVHSNVGFTPSPEASVTTSAGLSKKAANLLATVLSHRSTEMRWTLPTFQGLQGDVEYYTLFWNSATSNESLKILSDVNAHVIGHLNPNTEYWIFISVFNGVHSINSEVLRATTCDGEPRGMLPPEVVIINRTAVCVIWTSPSNPNGVVTEYSAYVNNKLYKTGMNVPGSFILRDLSPFTIYDIKVEVCTKYACVRRNETQIRTVEGTPSNMPTPIIGGITSRSPLIDWMSPGNPNGIILGYDLFWKTWCPCPKTQKLMRDSGGELCQVVTSQKLETVYGHRCYSPETKVCCNGMLYDPQSGYHCCEDKCIPFLSNSTESVCGGRIEEAWPTHHCGSEYHVRNLPGEVCCPDEQHNRVSTGISDSCCGRMPYSSSGNQICCAGRLHDGHRQQCDGGQIVNKDVECCGGEQEGVVYRHLPGVFCCGQDYVNMSGTICCSASSGESKAHVKKNDPMPVKCCETELIPESQRCCNGVGYNPLKYVCSDKISTGMTMKETGAWRTVCPASTQGPAQCGRCNFHFTSHICAVRREPQNSTGKASIEEICSSAEETVCTGSADTFSFADVNLEPCAMYEYSVSIWNIYGRGFSKAIRASASKDMSQGVSSPTRINMDNCEDAIVLNWRKTEQSNGPIIYFILLQDGIECSEGTLLSFSDTKGIQPFQEYSYQLKTCTIVRYTASSKVVVTTSQGVPQSILPPRVTAPRVGVLPLNWSVPEKPKSESTKYQFRQAGKGLILNITHRRRHMVTGLQPFTNYSFTLTACTSAGSASSEPFLGQTPQAAPQGVWMTPQLIIISSTTVELYWSLPEKPRGLFAQHKLSSKGTSVFLQGSEKRNFTDKTLLPNSRYICKLEATTGGGSGPSDGYIVEKILHLPEEIQPPYNITVIGPYSIFVAWNSSGILIPKVPIEYNVLLSAGSPAPRTSSASHHQSILLENLAPFTLYEIRIQACQNGGCGISDRRFVKTSEAVPMDLDAPVLKALGSACIEVKWTPPKMPNGVITNYFIHRRPAGEEEVSLLFVWSEGVLEFTDATDTLRPFMLYEYQVRAHNSMGSVESSWSSTWTLEAPPQDLPEPWAQATSAHSILLNWTEPRSPNGIISQYHVIYRERPDDPTVNVSIVHAFTVTGTSHQAHLFGLEPFTTYHIGVVAANQAGEVSSPWTLVRTLESSPSRLRNFTIEQKDNSQALSLNWSEPVRTNGVIKAYHVLRDSVLEYSGLKRPFLFRRLHPFTLYTLTLEACAGAGCAHAVPRPLQTGDAPPHSPSAPAIQSVGPTSVELSWTQPVNPNGKILRYEVVRRCFREGTGRSPAIPAEEKIVFTEYNTEKETFMYNDTGLQPWTLCEYKIYVWNSAGQTCGSWTMVRTKQAPPEGLSPPKITYVSTNPNKLLISWILPEQSNGVMQSYRLVRNGLLLPFSFDAVTFNHTDDELLPFSKYSYALRACSGGGCATSSPASVTTLEAAPAGLSPPALKVIGATQINVSWSPPSIQNGKITQYLLRCDGREYPAEQGLNLLVSQLQPHTQYNFSLVACTLGGCTVSEPQSARTMESPPQYMDPPRLQVTGSASIEITWSPPRNPNGQITSYELRRDEALVYTGLGTHYHDVSLAPGVEYGYAVVASNSQGGVLSPVVKEQTSSSAPSGLEPPELQVKGPHEILVTWDPPVRTNGHIVNYTLFIHELLERETKSIHTNSTHEAAGTQSLIVSQLKPFHRYEVRIQACTLLGCAFSGWTSIQTPEVTPLLQPPPQLEVWMAPGRFQPMVSLLWTGPLRPNGKVLYYEVYRRQVATQAGRSTPVLTYNGSSSSFMDSELLPFTEYEYQVWAVNSAGKATSNWTWCRTGPAPPEGLGAPKFHAVSSTQAVVNISTPRTPNGIISLYRLFSNTSGVENVLSEGTATQQTLHHLQPFTTYSVGVEACTCFSCCSKGPTAQLRTQPAPPSKLSSPQVKTLASRMVSFQWSAPFLPNGVIQSYEVQLRLDCPPESATACTPGQPETKYVGPEQSTSLGGLQPSSTYKVRVVAHNEVGSTASKWISFTTRKEVPQVRAPVWVNSSASTVCVNWSGTFLPNGRPKEFVLTDRGQRLYSGLDTTFCLPGTADKTFVFQVTCVTDEGSVKTPLIQYDASAGFGLVLTTPGEKRGSGHKNTEFYRELWFIMLMAMLALILLAIFLSLILQRKIRKEPYIRERPPLVPVQKRTPSLSVYPPGETHMGLADTKIPRSGTPVSVRSNRTLSVLRVPSQSHVSQAYSQDSLHRSISQLMDIQDKKVLVDDSLWETIMGHDSGLYVDEEDLMNVIKGFSSVTKEHTTFTDTQL
ncbi:PREDICTED: LOW QUALITY PROTEIN: usherin [Condylura cristata]|uniref:LOW QUALITY PROTEIN: usherin n=1 Tax=Condylura cristata TaxID=143302 RepID=UPI0003345F65|nr:PREDICTED: LOW QUALITY PROTEIN: usherin [Condylura cristata]